MGLVYPMQCTPVPAGYALEVPLDPNTTRKKYTSVYYSIPAIQIILEICLNCRLKSSVDFGCQRSRGRYDSPGYIRRIVRFLDLVRGITTSC
jgi:hypothetical protein